MNDPIVDRLVAQRYGGEDDPVEPYASDEGYSQGRSDLRDEILDILEAPLTDDPVDTLKAIAATIGAFEDGYDYFDHRGQWVLFPGDPTGGTW